MLTTNDRRGRVSSEPDLGPPDNTSAEADRITEIHGRKIGPNLSLDPHSLGELARLCRLLSDKTRLRILQTLGGGEHNVTAICGVLDQAQPTVSHHLSQLLQCRLLRHRRQGKQVFYRLNDEVVRPVTLPRDEHGGVSLDGSTRQVGRHPTGLQIVQAGLIIQIVSDSTGEMVGLGT